MLTMKRNLFFLFLITAILAAAQEKKSVTKKITVYTTADQTKLRLAENGILTFKVSRPIESPHMELLEWTGLSCKLRRKKTVVTPL